MRTWRVIVHVRKSGERFPLLLQPNGLPDQDATIYAATLRKRSGSFHTTLQILYSILALRRFTASREIDIEERIKTERFLDVHEWIDFADEISTGVKIATTAIILNRSLCFLAWRIRCHLAQRRDPSLRDSFEKRAERFLDEASEQIPFHGKGEDRDPLSADQKHLLLQILTNGLEIDRLWPNQFVGVRNGALLFWLLLLGHRVGETLSMMVSDLDFTNDTLIVTRRHDSPDDPRCSQPVVKGQGRRLAMPPSLIPPLTQYLTLRAALPLTHDYLFVATNLGPLSRSSVAKTFDRLTAVHPELAPLTPHVLRHTWVAAFRVAAKQMGLSDEEEARAKAVAMGWSDPTSDRFYAVRQRVEVANAISLRLQEDLLIDRK